MIQPGLQPDALDDQLVEPETAAQLYAYLQRHMQGFLPDGWTVEVRGSTWRAAPPPGVDLTAVSGRLVPAACAPPLDGTLSVAELDAHVARAAISLQMHSHTYRCRKGGRAKGDDDDCKLLWPRRVVHATGAGEHGVLLARHDVPHLVFYTKAVLLGAPVNHTVYVFAEMSRWREQLHRHMQRVANGSARAEDAPALPTVQDNALDASYYSTDYTTKGDGVDLSTDFMHRATRSAVSQRFAALYAGHRTFASTRLKPCNGTIVALASTHV